MTDHEFSNLFIKVYLWMLGPVVLLALLSPLRPWIFLPFGIAFGWSYFVARLCEWIDRP